MPRKSSLMRKSKQAPGGLKGIALHLDTGVGSRNQVQLRPANEHIKHSLFCESESPPPLQLNHGSLKRHLRTKRRSAALESNAISSRRSSHELFTPIDQDELAPLPENTNLGASHPNERQSAIYRLRRPQSPAKTSIVASPDNETLVASENDRLVPLPDRKRFNATPATLVEYHSPESVRSGSPTLVRSNSGATGQRAPSPCPVNAPPMRSMFPQYDPTKPMDRQSYYPATTPASTLSPDQISKFGSPMEKPALKRFDSGMAMNDQYEAVPPANIHDLRTLWNATSGIYPVSGRKLQLGIFQPINRGTSLTVGPTFDDAFWTMDSTSSIADNKSSKPLKQLTIKKYNPDESAPTPVAELVLPTSKPGRAEKDSQVSTIFPQGAATNAIETVANSPEAAVIAEWDPNAISREAARLAQDAVAEAYSRYRCELIRTTRRRDSIGAVTASYKLNHPMLGDLPITVTRAESQTFFNGPKAKITIHHPTATPAAIAADTLALATLDFSRSACIIDTPSFLPLDDPYIIDTALCALLAVAVIENDSIVAESTTFEPPPTKACVAKRKSKASLKTDGAAGSGRKWYKPFSKRKVQEMTPPVEEPRAVERKAEAFVEVGLNTAAFLIETGFKATRSAIHHYGGGREMRQQD